MIFNSFRLLIERFLKVSLLVVELLSLATWVEDTVRCYEDTCYKLQRYWHILQTKISSTWVLAEISYSYKKKAPILSTQLTTLNDFNMTMTQIQSSESLLPVWHKHRKHKHSGEPSRDFSLSTEKKKSFTAFGNEPLLSKFEKVFNKLAREVRGGSTGYSGYFGVTRSISRGRPQLECTEN